jgi:probable F420-dependent oxidoreductase
MRISLTMPVEDPRRAASLFGEIETAGFDAAYTFESSHDPFIPVAAAAGGTHRMNLGTAVAIGFARNPMVLANLGYDLQVLTEGRFVLGIGSQIRPHIEKRFSETWSRPAARMAEMVRAIRAIWAAWEGEGPLDFRGEFYRHTLMTPAFDPGPNPFGPPPIMVGGFGPRMVAVAGEVADGLIVHPFTSRHSMEQLTLPALDAGLEAAGRTRGDVEVLWVTMVVTWEDDAGYEEAQISARQQLAFYGSTPAYRPVLDVHGWGDLQPELNRLSKQGRWDTMTELIPAEMVEALAVVAPRREVAARLAERVDGITDSVGLVNNRNPDPDHFADIVADLRAGIPE